MSVPNTFATATSPIPLANLDANFAYYDAAFSIVSTALSFISNPTLSAGTANGVTYLNGSKVLTSGAALTFDGTNLFSIATATPKLRLSASSASADFGMDFYYPGSASVYAGLTLSFATGGLKLASGNSGSAGYYQTFEVNGAEGMRLTSTGLSTQKDATIQGVTVGRGAGAVSSNTAVGSNALVANTSGTFNAAFGYQSLYTNSTGGSNTASGYAALLSNTTASNNAAFGFGALYNNTTGASNTAVGSSALLSNTTASNNTAVGYQAGYSNTTGERSVYLGNLAGSRNTGYGYNTSVGSYSLYGIGTGAENTAVGESALFALTDGSYNTALGNQALKSNTTASGNTAVGYQAGYSNTTGTNSAFVGRGAGYSVTGAYNNNTAIGDAALYYTTGGSDNTAIGQYALGGATTGSFNTAVGAAAGQAMTTGSKNTILGRYSGNQGGLDIRTANNYIVLSDGDGNPRVVVDGSGNLGLGVTPSASWFSGSKVFQFGATGALFTNGSNNSAFSHNAVFVDASTTYQVTGQPASYYRQFNGTHNWFTAPSGTAGNAITFTQAMTLDASGHLLVGRTSSSGSPYTLELDNGTSDNRLGMYAGGVLTGGLLCATNEQRVLALGASTVLTFQTNGSERARIDTSGNLGVGTTVTNTLVNSNSFALNVSNGFQVCNHISGTASGAAYVYFGYNATNIGSITQNGTTGVLYNIMSDARLKTVKGAVSGHGERIDALLPVEYEWKADGAKARGFLAHQFQEVYPSSVTGSKDAVDDEGKPVYQAIQASTAEVIADLVAELQSLRARLAVLEAK